MCARYYIDDFLVKKVEDELDKVEGQAPSVRSGDMHPSENVPVLAEDPSYRGEHSRFSSENMHDMAPCWELMDWGFPTSNGKGLIINGRSETVREKYTFRDCFLNRRCVVPAHAFYEWDGRKEKITFSREDDAVLYLAGLFQDSIQGHRFVILTAQAPEEIYHIHERIPLIFGKEDVSAWIYDDSAAEGLLRVQPPRLRLYREYEQQRFSL